MNLRFIVLGLGVVFLVGCSSFAPYVVKQANDATEQKLSEERKNNSARSYTRKPISNTQNGSLFLGQPFATSSRTNIPSFMQEDGFGHTIKEAIPLRGHLDRISKAEGISIYIRGDAVKHLNTQFAQNRARTTGNTGDSAGQTIDKLTETMEGGPSFSLPRYKGTLAGLLDLLTSKVGLSWAWQSGRVEVYKFDRKTFIVNTDAQEYNVSLSIDNTASGKSDGAAVSGASTQKITNNKVYNSWADLLEQVKSVLSSDGVITSNKSMGSITLIDTPTVLSKAEHIIEEFNASLEKRIIVDVTVLEISSSVGTRYGVDWDTIFTRANGVGTLNTNNVFTSGDGMLGYTINDPDNRLNGTSWMIEALASQGFSSQSKNIVANVQNGVQHPFQDIVETHYVASTKTTQTDQSSSTEIQTNVITEGVTVFTRPQVTDDGRILLNVSYSSGNLLSLDTVEADGVSITTPKRHLTSTFLTTMLESGQSVLMTGFRQNSAKSSRSGTGHQDAWVLGGQRTDDSVVADLAIVVRVSLLD